MQPPRAARVSRREGGGRSAEERRRLTPRLTILRGARQRKRVRTEWDAGSCPCAGPTSGPLAASRWPTCASCSRARGTTTCATGTPSPSCSRSPAAEREAPRWARRPAPTAPPLLRDRRQRECSVEWNLEAGDARRSGLDLPRERVRAVAARVPEDEVELRVRREAADAVRRRRPVRRCVQRSAVRVEPDDRVFAV